MLCEDTDAFLDGKRILLDRREAFGSVLYALFFLRDTFNHLLDDINYFTDGERYVTNQLSNMYGGVFGSVRHTGNLACDDVRWLPAWGIDRMKSMIRERADWCISRQRRWGLPIPVVYCRDCGKPIVTDETIEAISALFGEKGSNAWFELEAEDILPKGFTCPHCGSSAGFEKETDTLDGWFDSGSTHFASMKKDQGFWPADMYIEGLDQYRGWFQSALLTAVGSTGVAQAPFKECLTHGWTVDGEGKAMHKSLGNGMDPNEIDQSVHCFISGFHYGYCLLHVSMDLL